MRILKATYFLAFCILVICSSGCEKEKPTKNVPFDPANFNTYKPEDILIQIGKHTLTRKDIDRFTDLRLRTIRMSLPAGQRAGDLNRMAIQTPILANAVGAFRAQTAILDWAETNGIKVTKQDIAEFEKKFMAGCRYEGNSFKAFKRQFSSSELDTIKERIRVEALSAKVREHFISKNKAKIKPIPTASFMSYLTNYNHAAEATNAVIWARATNLWQKAKAGGDFGELAGANTEDESHPEKGEWGAFRIGDLGGDGDLEKVVAAMKVGDVSPPLEADNGLNIIRLDAVTDVRDNPISDAQRNASSRYHLSRIFLRLPEIYDIPPAEEAAATLKMKAEDDEFLKFLQGLMAVDGVKYPHGEAVFETARKMMQMPMMLQQEGMGKESK